MIVIIVEDVMEARECGMFSLGRGAMWLVSEWVERPSLGPKEKIGPGGRRMITLLWALTGAWLGWVILGFWLDLGRRTVLDGGCGYLLECYRAVGSHWNVDAMAVLRE